MKLPDALAAVAAEMRKQAKTLAGFCPDSSGSPLGKQMDAWADRIEALAQPGAVGEAPREPLCSRCGG